MKLEPFAMERLQSTYETPGGLQPVRERRAPADARRARRRYRRRARRCWRRRCATRRRTARVPLRAAIAALYPGATADHVQVTNGGAEANYITTWNLVEPGDEVVMMVPNYMQTWGLARAFGATVKEWPLIAAGSSESAATADGASTSTRLERLDVAAHEADRHLQSEQPDRRAVRGRRSRSHRGDRRPARQLDPLRRDLSRRRARRPRDADDVGPVRSRHRHERAVEGVRAAGPAHRLDRGAAAAASRRCGRITTTRRSRPAR